jgi:hypothetical protein
MLIFSRQELFAMTRDEIVSRILVLQSEREAVTQPTLRISRETLREMGMPDLVTHAFTLQDEIQWVRLRAMTSSGAGDTGRGSS